MSRTTRNVPNWALNMAASYANPAPHDLPYEERWMRRCVRFNARLGRDGSTSTELSMPNSSSPRCYNTWSNIGNSMSSKRSVKRAVAQLSRRVAKRAVRAEIRQYAEEELLADIEFLQAEQHDFDDCNEWYDVSGDDDDDDRDDNIDWYENERREREIEEQLDYEDRRNFNYEYQQVFEDCYY